MVRLSKDKYKNKAKIQNKYIVKEVSNVEHAKAMNITINEYKERLDRALRNYLNTLIDVVTEIIKDITLLLKGKGVIYIYS